MWPIMRLRVGRTWPVTFLSMLPSLGACGDITSPREEIRNTVDVTVMVTLDSVPAYLAQVVVTAPGHQSCFFFECSSTTFFAGAEPGGRYRVLESVTWDSCEQLVITVNLWVADGQPVFPPDGDHLIWTTDRQGCGPHHLAHDFSSGSSGSSGTAGILSLHSPQ